MRLAPRPVLGSGPSFDESIELANIAADVEALEFVDPD